MTRHGLVAIVSGVCYAHRLGLEANVIGGALVLRPPRVRKIEKRWGNLALLQGAELPISLQNCGRPRELCSGISAGRNRAREKYLG
jgi:hypothetical protein